MDNKYNHNEKVKKILEEIKDLLFVDTGLILTILTIFIFNFVYWYNKGFLNYYNLDPILIEFNINTTFEVIFSNIYASFIILIFIFVINYCINFLINKNYKRSNNPIVNFFLGINIFLVIFLYIYYTFLNRYYSLELSNKITITLLLVTIILFILTISLPINNLNKIKIGSYKNLILILISIIITYFFAFKEGELNAKNKTTYQKCVIENNEYFIIYQGKDRAILKRDIELESNTYRILQNLELMGDIDYIELSDIDKSNNNNFWNNDTYLNYSHTQ